MEEMEKLNNDDFVLSEWEQRQLDQMIRDNELKYARKEGIEKNKIETARKMVEKNMKMKDIIEITGLTEEEINDLK